MRRLLFRLLVWGGLATLARWMHRHTVTILLYHGVAPDTTSGLYNYRRKHLSPDVFSRQIDYLTRTYTLLPLDEAIERLAARTLPPNTLVITFDDGYANNARYAFPILSKYNAPATFFLTTDFVDKGVPLWVDRLEYALGMDPHSTRTYEERKVQDQQMRAALKTLPTTTREKKLEALEKQAGVALTDYEDHRSVYAPLTWEEAITMNSKGATFGAHTCSHPILSRVSVEEQKNEIVGSYELVTKHLSNNSSIFAYPNGQPGDETPDTIVLLKQLGVRGALTTIPGANTPSTDLYRLHRYSMDATEDWDTFVLTVSGARAWLSSCLRRTRGMLALHSSPMTHVGDRKEVRWFNDVSTSYRREYDRETTDGFSFRMRRDKVAAVLPGEGAGKTVLDIACGPGVMVAPLTKRGYHVTSVDAAPEMIARAKEEHSGNPLADFAVGDVYHLNYPDATFDCVIAMGLVEYLDDEPRAFSEMARVLKPGGLLMVSFPNYWAPWRIWSRFVMFLTSFPRRLYKRLTGNPGHYITHREYTLRTAKAWFTRVGVTPTRAWYYNFKLIPWPLDQALPRITVAQSKLCESLDATPLRSLGTGFNLSGTKS